MKYALVLLSMLMLMSAVTADEAVSGSAPVLPLQASPDNQWRMLELPDGESAVQVRVDFHLLDLQEINDALETFEFSGVLTLSWQDSRQAFDPVEVGVQEMVYNGSYQFNELAPAWYPQVILANALEVQAAQGVLVRVQPDGSSRLVQTINAVAKSHLDLHRYPFDKQQLNIVFEVLGFDDSEVMIESGTVTGQVAGLQVPQWDLTNISMESRLLAAPYAGASGSSSAVVVNLKTERRSFFLLRLVVLPMMVIMALSWAVFWMDRSSLGDRMSVSFVGILTAVAYQTMISSIMSQISYMTLIHAFLYFSFVLMCATVVINLVVGNFDRQGDFDRGDLIDRRCRWIFPCVYLVLLCAIVSIAFIWF